MKKPFLSLVAFVFTMLMFQDTTLARDAARDLRRMVGYTIIMADTVDEVFESRSGEKFVRLSNGQTFKADFLLLDPLPVTDVIVFAKPHPKEIVEKYKGKLPERMFYSYKLLIDNETYDATPQ